jgi:LEA14-like dessication related protein
MTMTSRAAGLTPAGLALVALLGAACASLKPPTLSVDGLKVGDMGVTGVAMDVRFRVRNPNPEPMTVDRFEYELFLNGERLGRGYDPKGFELEGFGEEKVTSRFDVNLLSLPGAVREVMRHDRGHARVKGHFYVRRGGGLKKMGFDADADVDLRR